MWLGCFSRLWSRDSQKKAIEELAANTRDTAVVRGRLPSGVTKKYLYHFFDFSFGQGLRHRQTNPQTYNYVQIKDNTLRHHNVDFIKKTFQIGSWGVCIPNWRFSFHFFSLRRWDTTKWINKHTYMRANIWIPQNLRASYGFKNKTNRYLALYEKSGIDITI